MYPIEYIETANTAMEITRIKNAESLSTKKPKFKKEEPEIDNENVSPKITDIEKMIPLTAFTSQVTTTLQDMLDLIKFFSGEPWVLRQGG